MRPAIACSLIGAACVSQQAAAVLQNPDTPDQVSSTDATNQWQAYEAGALGAYPQVTFQSTSFTAPRVHVTKWDPRCDHDSYTLLAPHGTEINDNKAMLLDSRGQLVWLHQEKGSVHNLRVQKYKGNDYITFFVGDDGFWYHGSGYYKMLDSNYHLAHVVKAVNVDGDYHDFSITPDNTALITAFVKKPWDLEFKGRADGYIWDCYFQEIDIVTGQLLFEWRASEHYNFSDMSIDSWASWTGHIADPWDWYHINSVVKDTHGNYLVAARLTQGLTYISGQDGHIIWELGGKLNDFFDMSEGNATHFSDPHMASFDDPNDSSIITLFDNTHRYPQTVAHIEYSVGLRIHLESAHNGGSQGVATVLSQYEHPNGVHALNEGSMHKLDNGNYFIGYGSSPVLSEFAEDGEMLCNTHLAPLHVSDVIGQVSTPQTVQTYRVYKQKWIGLPAQAPTVSRSGTSLAWSWNGATEVRSWKLEGKRIDSAMGRWTGLGQFEKNGFETEVALGSIELYEAFRLTALDRKERPLGAWVVMEDGSIRELVVESGVGFPQVPSIGYLALLATGVVVLVWANRRSHRRRELRIMKEKVRLGDLA